MHYTSLTVTAPPRQDVLHVLVCIVAPGALQSPDVGWSFADIRVVLVKTWEVCSSHLCTEVETGFAVTKSRKLHWKEEGYNNLTNNQKKIKYLYKYYIRRTFIYFKTFYKKTFLISYLYCSNSVGVCCPPKYIFLLPFYLLSSSSSSFPSSLPLPLSSFPPLLSSLPLPPSAWSPETTAGFIPLQLQALSHGDGDELPPSVHKQIHPCPRLPHEWQRTPKSGR